MRIAISMLNFRPGHIGGTETYLREVISQLPNVAGNDEIVLIADRDLAPQLQDTGVDVAVVDAGAKEIVCQRLLEAAAGYRARHIEKAFKALSPDVALFPQQVIFPKRVACPAILVIHDFYHLELPQHLSTVQRWYRRTIYHKSLFRADRIITVSNYTKRCLLSHYPSQDEPGRIVTIHHGYRPSHATVAMPQIVNGAPYLFYPAISHPHKNHLQLFRAVARLRDAELFPYRLVLSGERTGYWKQLQREVRRLNLESVVVHTGFLRFDQVQCLYRDAAAVVFPSSYEGFGIPVLEAAAAGKRVITSRLDIFRELGVPDRFRIDFDDAEALHRAIVCEHAAGLERPPQTWTETARQTLEAARETAGSAYTIRFPFTRENKPLEANARIARAA